MVHGRHILYLALRVCAYNKLATLYVTYVGYVFLKIFSCLAMYVYMTFYIFFISTFHTDLNVCCQ